MNWLLQNWIWVALGIGVAYFFSRGRRGELVAKPLTTYEGIIAAAKNRKCDVIFMASHGPRGFTRLIMGSITQKVLAHVRIPMVMYR